MAKPAHTVNILVNVRTNGLAASKSNIGTMPPFCVRKAISRVVASQPSGHRGLSRHAAMNAATRHLFVGATKCLQFFRCRIFSKLVQVIGPFLHHLSAFGQILRKYVAPPQPYRICMGKLALDRFNAPPALAEICGRHAPEAGRGHFAQISDGKQHPGE